MKRKIVQIVSTLLPNVITQFAYKKLTNPQIKKLRKNELVTLEKADKEKIRFGNFNIQFYTWKAGHKKILLVHGWEG